MSAERVFNLSEATNLFKIKYEELSENVYNSANVLLGRCKKSYDFTGKQKYFAVPQSFSGGVGSGTLPKANTAIYEDATFSAKKVYAVVQIDREAIKAASNDEGAFVRATKEVVKKGVESYMRNMSRILFGEGDGKLGTGDGATNVSGAGSSGDPYVIVISAASFKEANWEERDLVNIGTETTTLEITEVIPSTRTIKLVGSSAILAAATGSSALSDDVHMQGSKDNDPQGLKGVLDATSGTKYNISIGRRWQAVQKDASGAGLTTDLMNEVMLDVEKQCGKVPNLILTSYKQYRKLLNLLEDQKEYSISPRSENLKGHISFRGVQFMSSMGAIGVFPERFCEDDRMYFLNDNKIEICHRPGFGWFDDDGTVFLREASSDEYSARYGGYCEIYIQPPFHGVLTNLA